MRALISLPAALLLSSAVAACSDEGANPAQAPQEPQVEEQAFYVGEWAADPTWCTDQSEGFPITITADQFRGRENICEITEVTETPEGGWSAQLSCVSEGTTTQEPIVFSPAGEQLAITWPEREAEPTLFSSCQ